MNAEMQTEQQEKARQAVIKDQISQGMRGMPTGNIQAIGQMVGMMDFGSRAYVCKLEELRIVLQSIEATAPGLTVKDLIDNIVSGPPEFETVLKEAFLAEMQGR